MFKLGLTASKDFKNRARLKYIHKRKVKENSRYIYKRKTQRAKRRNSQKAQSRTKVVKTQLKQGPHMAY